MDHNHLLIAFALIGLAGIGAQWVAWRTGLPAIALMLVAGFILGPATGLIDPHHDFGEMLEPIVSIAVAIILFEGGLTLKFSELKKAGAAIGRLVVIGVPVAWVAGSLALYHVAGFDWPVSILFAGILVVTGPTVIMPLLRQSNLAPRPKAVLKWEGIVNDPIGALLAVITYEYLVQAQAGSTFIDNMLALLVSMIVAGGMGYAAAYAVRWMFPRGLVPEFLKAPVLLVMVIGTFVLSNFIQQETGLLAVTVMGIALANMKLSSARTYLPFKENITILLVSGVFIILSASLDVEALMQFQGRWFLFLLVLLFIVRPLTVFISLAFSKVPWREQLFIGWIAPRGIVAVAITGLFALRLDEIGYTGGQYLVTLAFAVVAATIVAHGFTMKPLARMLGLNGPESNGVLIIGGQSFSFSLAKTLRMLGVPVTVADTGWQRLAPARSAGIPIFHGEILSEATEDELDFSQFQALVATTDNEAYNALVCSEFVHEVGSDAVYQLGDASEGDPHALSDSLRGRALFARGHGVEDVAESESRGWTLRAIDLTIRHDFKDALSRLPEGADLLFILREDGQLRFTTHASQPEGRPGDIIVAYCPPGTPELHLEVTEESLAAAKQADTQAEPEEART
ncbi:cation:proton antiporter [Sphingomicrobium flavum]|uniref:cation:proton antiporter n=1 Tax=Sphingomicrobium flavum TaxID=1229164 RepID=UPI0021ADA149|nr:sodium:proton antiporter [Sphingomicrobium flavum]